MNEHTDIDALSPTGRRWLRDRAAALLHDDFCRCGKGHRAHGRVYLEMAGTVVRALSPLINTSIIPPGEGKP